MIGFKAFRNTPTSFDLNGPILSFVQQPTTKSVCNAGVATFIGIATATFPTQTPTNPAVGLGSIAYRWYEVGVGSLSDRTNVTGTATTTLTLSNLSNPVDNERQFYLTADYVSSGKTPNAINDVLQSEQVSLIVHPSIVITTQPSNVTTALNNPGTFNIVARTTYSTTDPLRYRWKLNGVDAPDGIIIDTVDSSTRKTTVSGATTPTLTVSADKVGIQSVSCTVFHDSACNSPLSSNIVQLNVVSAESITRSILKYEIVRDDNTILYELGEQNIFVSALNFTSDLSNPSRSIVVYAPEKDINVKITLAGAAGQSFGGNLGGAGGISSFEYTLRRNFEYVFKLNPSVDPFGGTGGGGGAAFFYEKARLLAVCGGGGGASSGGKGGDGGGAGVAGQSGSGRNSGSGGALINPGFLTTSGLASNGITGGRVESCTIGTYYRIQGFAPCSNIGDEVPWRNSSGIAPVGENGIITAQIARGYKTGTSYRNNGGKSSSQENGIFVGGGGAGTVGGNATQSPGSSGGGGSGYTNGSVSIISTQLGGNTSTSSFVTIEIQS